MESEVNRNIEEQLSAFLDGELSAHELQLLVRRLERNEEHRATLARYSSIGGMLRNEQSQQYPANQLYAKVMAAVASDSDVAVAAPVSGTDPERSRSTWFKPAIAAAVSAFAVAALLGTNLLSPDPVNSIQQVAISSPSAPEPGLNRQGGEAGRSNAGGEFAKMGRGLPAAKPAPALDEDRMLTYLVSHGEYSRSFQGAMMDSRVFIQQTSFED